MKSKVRIQSEDEVVPAAAPSVASPCHVAKYVYILTNTPIWFCVHFSLSNHAAVSPQDSQSKQEPVLSL